jgi:predicted nucleic acid-binding protein
MLIYADTSFLVAVYALESDSQKALNWLQKAKVPLPFTQIHRHELRNAIRLRVFREEITASQRSQVFNEIESDLKENILSYTAIQWTEAFRESDEIGALHGERLGARSIDLLHVGIARSLKCEEFLTFDLRQASVAKACGFKLKALR